MHASTSTMKWPLACICSSLPNDSCANTPCILARIPCSVYQSSNMVANYISLDDILVEYIRLASRWVDLPNLSHSHVCVQSRHDCYFKDRCSIIFDVLSQRYSQGYISAGVCGSNALNSFMFVMRYTSPHSYLFMTVQYNLISIISAQAVCASC